MERRLQEDGGGPVRGELHGGVADVHELGGDVALPEARDALVAKDVGEGAEGAAVGWGGAERVEGVGEGVGLELEADLNDIEGGDDEPGVVVSG